MKTNQLINVIGLIIGFTSFYFEVLTPFWGVIFLFWVYQGLKEKQLVLFYPANKKDQPIIYWLLVIMWGLVGLYFLLYPALGY